jgi:hypothetical protein
MAVTVVTTTVFCRTRFIAFHYWKDAPEPYKYLSYPHRHEFHVEAHVRVTDKDRQVEFQHLRWIIDHYLRNEYADAQTSKGAIPASCEMIAERLAENLEARGFQKPIIVTVSEDGENGAMTKLI